MSNHCFKLIRFGLVTDDWRRLFIDLRKSLKWYVLSWLIVVFILPLAALGAILEKIYLISPYANTAPFEAYLYVSLGILYEVTRWYYYIVIFLITFAVFIPITLIGFSLTKTVIDFGFQLFYPLDHKFYRVIRRYQKWDYISLNKFFKVPSIIFFIAYSSVGFLILKKSSNIDISVIKLVGFGAIVAVLFVFGIVWYIYIKIIKIRSQSHSVKYLQQYLFSPHSMQRRFKETLDLLVMLAVLGWLILPNLSNVFDKVAINMVNDVDSDWNYSEKRQTLIDIKTIKTRLEISKIWTPPSKELFADELNFLRPILKKGKGFWGAIPELMSLFFICATLAGCLSVGIPTLYLVYLSSDYKKMTLRLLVNSGKTFILTIMLQLLITKAFFVKISGIVVFGSIFFFLLTYFFTHEAESLNKENIVTF